MALVIFPTFNAFLFYFILFFLFIGDYPHLFNTSKNQGCKLPHLPDIRYYNPDFRSVKDREELLKWHAENRDQEFDNDACLTAYCASDVTVLRSACVKFKNLVRKATTVEGAEVDGINVFADSTIAGSAMSIFRQLVIVEDHKATLVDQSVIDARLKAGVWTRTVDGVRLDKDQILKTQFVKSNVPQPPALGYGNRSSNHSQKSVIWLEFVAKQTGVKIEHARNGGEKKILTYFVDGYDHENGM